MPKVPKKSLGLGQLAPEAPEKTFDWPDARQKIWPNLWRGGGTGGGGAPRCRVVKRSPDDGARPDVPIATRTSPSSNSGPCCRMRRSVLRRLPSPPPSLSRTCPDVPGNSKHPAVTHGNASGGLSCGLRPLRSASPLRGRATGHEAQHPPPPRHAGAYRFIVLDHLQEALVFGGEFEEGLVPLQAPPPRCLLRDLHVLLNGQPATWGAARDALERGSGGWGLAINQ